MSILNPQYAFLEADYKNPNLTKEMLDEQQPDLNQVKSKFENASEEIQKNLEVRKGVHTSLKKTFAAVYFQINSKLGILVWIPVDNLCIAYLALIEIFA